MFIAKKIIKLYCEKKKKKEKETNNKYFLG